MAVIHDTIPVFELFQPLSIEDALALKRRYGKTSWTFAGGLDSIDWFKDRIKRPDAVIDLGGIAELKGIKAAGDGLEIGAMTTLTEIAESSDVRSKFALLSDAAAAVATPQIRNQATVGGNVSQDTRCWYYRGGWPCYRAGGNICYADTPTSVNREHAIFEANRCVAVNPSDTAPALIALDAKFVLRSQSGEREVNAEDFFITPSTDIRRMTILEPGDLLTAIRIPGTLAGAQVPLREGPGPPGVGLPAGERRGGDEALGDHHRGHPHRRERGGTEALPAHRRRAAAQRPAGDGRGGGGGGRARGPRRSSPSPQRLQDSAHAQSRTSCHSSGGLE